MWAVARSWNAAFANNVWMGFASKSCLIWRTMSSSISQASIQTERQFDVWIACTPSSHKGACKYDVHVHFHPLQLVTNKIPFITFGHPESLQLWTLYVFATVNVTLHLSLGIQRCEGAERHKSTNASSAKHSAFGQRTSNNLRRIQQQHRFSPPSFVLAIRLPCHPVRLR